MTSRDKRNPNEPSKEKKSKELEAFERFFGFTEGFVEEVEPADRIRLYSDIQRSIVQGERIGDDEVILLTWGMWADPEVDSTSLPFHWGEFRTLLEQQAQINPQGFAANRLNLMITAGQAFTDPSTLGVAEDDPVVNAIIGAIGGGLVGGAAGFGRASSSSIAGGSRFGSSPLGQRIMNRLARASISFADDAGAVGGRLFQGLFGTRLRAAGTVLGGMALGGGLLGAQLSGQSDPRAGQSTPSPEEDPTAPQEPETITVLDRDGSLTGTPGTLIEVPADEFSQTSVDNTPTPVSSNDLPAGLTELASAYGIDPSIFNYAFQQEDFNEEIYGEVTLGVDRFPQGVDIGGQAPPGESRRMSPAEWEALNPSDRAMLQREGFTEGDSSFIRPGATIAPAALREWQGRTLLEHAADASRATGVPLDILYGIITVESGWNASAVSPNGNRVGLAQIDLSNNPTVTREAAINPVFSINWTANNLKSVYDESGSWETAIVSHRDPEAARLLQQANQFANPYVKAYLQTVTNAAMSSSLGNVTFGGPESFLQTADIRTVGGGGGTRISPFEAPDEASLRQFAKSAVSEVFGREEPSEEELATFVDRLTGHFREKYDEDVKNIRGQESSDVDPEARFMEWLEESGEGQFRQERDKRRSMMEYMASVAQILESGV